MTTDLATRGRAARALAARTTHAAGELAGAHVIAQMRDDDELTTKNFRESLHAA
jgi:hypothetical protein